MTPATPSTLDPETIADLLKNGAVVVDLRDAIPFGREHIADSVHIKAKSPNFLDRVLRFTPEDKPIILIADALADVEWSLTGLMAHRTIAGFAIFESLKRRAHWLKALPALEPVDLHNLQNEGEPLVVLDVREPSEWADGCIDGAIRIPMNEVMENIKQFSNTQRIAITCAGGQRSSLIASLLLTRGFNNIYNLTGGMKAWLGAKLPTTKL